MPGKGAEQEAIPITPAMHRRGVKLKEGHRYKLLITRGGGRYVLEVQLDPDDPKAFDDKITLETADGKWKKTLQLVTEGEEFREGWSRLVFEDVPRGRRFRCTIDPGAEGEPYLLFPHRELELEFEEEAQAGAEGA